MTSVSINHEQTTLPLLLEKLLQQQGIAYQLRLQSHAGPTNCQVRACLLGDSGGHVLALFPADHLLDLKRLAQVVGRQLEPVRDEQLQRILSKHQLNQLPGLPVLFDSPCIYHLELREQQTLWLQSGLPGWLLEVRSSDTQRLLEKASGARFAVALEAITRPPRDDSNDVQDLTNAVQQFTALRVRQRLEETVDLPPLPQTAQRILRLRADPDAGITELADIVETDPGLAAQVVSWAASPFYAAPGRIRSVEDAIGRVLGFDLVINLAIGLTLGRTLALPKDAPQGCTPYWEQAIYTAAVIEGLGRALPPAQRPEAGLSYLAGLLHNFGYLLLAHIFPPHFTLLCRHMEANPHVPASLIEQHLLGVSREQIGCWLMRYWDMPEELVLALRHQHDPDYSGDQHVYANLIYVALSQLAERGIGCSPGQSVPDALYQRLGLSAERAAQITDKVLVAEEALRLLAKQLQH